LSNTLHLATHQSHVSVYWNFITNHFGIFLKIYYESFFSSDIHAICPSNTRLQLYYIFLIVCFFVLYFLDKHFMCIVRHHTRKAHPYYYKLVFFSFILLSHVGQKMSITLHLLASHQSHVTCVMNHPSKSFCYILTNLPRGQIS
jgi:hypothetical protein